ncbi:hypothetical protein EJ04DRAFT_245612 [Polyplosphaeria fusca]|uniref:Uncharacterized protein n=1 Tax=Polyplosphaeria fusca TaxID=682080 RepID=A0A9P4R0D4_9PLEO|nr:hypothetical protein EJ04DRAFT_245612 [Polyplosphaeria fusca]
MRTKMLLELRNMVYLHLCPSAHVQMDLWHTPTEPCGYPPPPFEAEYTQAPPWWPVDFVGQEFLDELVLQWYHTSTFVVNGFNTDEFRRLLTENPFIPHRTPRELINNVTVRVQTDLGRETELAGHQRTLEEVLDLTQTLKEPARICIDFQGSYSGPYRAAERSRAEQAGTDRILSVMTTVSPLVTSLKSPVRGEVDGVLFYEDLTKLSPGAWKTEYLLFQKHDYVYRGPTK